MGGSKCSVDVCALGRNLYTLLLRMRKQGRDVAMLVEPMFMARYRYYEGKTNVLSSQGLNLGCCSYRTEMDDQESKATYRLCNRMRWRTSNNKERVPFTVVPRLVEPHHCAARDSEVGLRADLKSFLNPSSQQNCRQSASVFEKLHAASNGVPHSISAVCTLALGRRASMHRHLALLLTVVVRSRTDREIAGNCVIS